jgi:hypothetical protein
MANKIDWNIIDDGSYRMTFKIPVESFKKKNKWWEFWKNSYDFNNKHINRQIKIIKLFKIE